MTATDSHPADHVVADQQPVFALLANPATHGFSGEVTRIDTHGAALFLVGDDVYKVKRAVRFSFMDLSTLARREAACRRELELNRPAAPDIYLDLVAITRRDGALHLGGEGAPGSEIVEWAVHMRRFDENATLDRIADAGGLTPARIDALAKAVFAFHQGAAVHRDVDPAASLAGVADGLIEGLGEMPELFAPARVAAFASTLADTRERLAPLLARRARAGEVRRCHGDLHLRNVALIEGTPVLFDALEFDEALATIDRLYDLAFLLMDLDRRGQAHAANLMLNRYLAACGDAPPYDGLTALPLFLALRAGIRARVMAAALGSRPGAARAAAHAETLGYLSYAERVLVPVPARLIAVGGLSGTGKSTLAANLAPHIGPAPGAVHLRSDVERKRLAGVDELEALPATAYSQAAADAVYAELRARAGAVLAAGHAVVVDGMHQRVDERAAIEEVARGHGAAFIGLWLDAPVEARAARVEARRGDASDATPEVVRRQAAWNSGAPGWTTIDASGAPEVVLARALARLGATR
ncbi:AAA family ATPase [Ancylobacter pratisalsi]|uniref:AAA family ATPase n=1 Tax=Ancylobacter pratisalsi TaxID=1745854 RepID=A0A6P1YLC6_9HYPH|nr:bifunctional aminoglycoside phosphotransferase/ATP-binding protein [Ancylobacter pratisalsi]QIB34237.1 AAA family ATPase [Ancylobacter pratisalsi]